MKTLVNINTGLIVKALENAKPVTVVGTSAVKSFQNYLTKHALLAGPLENAIESLVAYQHDPGLESLISTLKTVLPEAKRKVSIAYEAMTSENKGLFGAASVEAENAVAALYKHNSKEIISQIANGALDAYKSNPSVVKLIAYAKAAAVDSAMNGISLAKPSLDYNITLLPVLNITNLGSDATLVQIGDRLYVKTGDGKIVPTAISALNQNIPAIAMTLITVLGSMVASYDSPNLLRFRPQIEDSLTKYLGIKEFSIDLLGDISNMVTMNGLTMPTDKAKTLLEANKDQYLTAMLMYEDANNILKLVNSTLDVLEQFRGVILGTDYATRFVSNNGASDVIITPVSSGYAVVAYYEGSVIGAKLFSTIYDVIADKVIVDNFGLSEAISLTFNEQMRTEAGTATVKRKLLEQLAEEKAQYITLLSRIKAEHKELSEIDDVNEEKVAELKRIEAKTNEAISKLNQEIEKLAE